jgi:hypothetical protein
MNIRNRLKKLENEVIDDSTVCACYPQKRFEMWIADLGVDSDSSEPKLDGEALPDVCADCGKPVEKNKITVQLCDRTTPDRFPGEWQAGRNK